VPKRIVIILFPIALALAARAEDWPQWRGRDRDGVWHEAGIRRNFPAGGLPVRWRAPVGYGFSSPVIAKGRVYVTDALLDRPKVRGRVLCFEETTGKLLWTFHGRKPTIRRGLLFLARNRAEQETPVVQDGKVYATGPQAHNLYCLEAASGNLVWERDLAQDYQIEETATISASPLVDGNQVILQVGGKPDACVVAFDRKSGKGIWRSLNETGGHASPVIIKAGGRRQLIVWTTQSVSSLDPATGKLFWREGFAAGSSGAVATPVFSGNRLLVSGLMLKLDEKKSSASVLWPESRVATRRILSGTSTPLLQGNHVYSLNPPGTGLPGSGHRQANLETDRVTRPKGGSCVHAHDRERRFSFHLQRTGRINPGPSQPSGHEEIGRTRLMELSYSFGGRKLTWAAPPLPTAMFMHGPKGNHLRVAEPVIFLSSCAPVKMKQCCLQRPQPRCGWSWAG
jgi:hypothetical protein